jgi:hypothetical protein
MRKANGRYHSTGCDSANLRRYGSMMCRSKRINSRNEHPGQIPNVGHAFGSRTRAPLRPRSRYDGHRCMTHWAGDQPTASDREVSAVFKWPQRHIMLLTALVLRLVPANDSRVALVRRARPVTDLDSDKPVPLPRNPAKPNQPRPRPDPMPMRKRAACDGLLRKAPRGRQ